MRNNQTKYILYAANYNQISSSLSNSAIHAFELDDDGIPVFIGSFGTGENPVHVALHPHLPFLYVASFSEKKEAPGRLDCFHVFDDGSLEISHAPVYIDKYCRYIAIDPSGEHLYLATQDASDNFYHFELQSDGTAVLRMMTTVLSNPVCLTFHPKHAHLIYICGFGDASDGTHIGLYNCQPNGNLTPIQSFTTGKAPHSFAFSPNGDYAFSANWADNSICCYIVNSESGELTLYHSEYDLFSRCHDVLVYGESRIFVTLEGSAGVAELHYAISDGAVSRMPDLHAQSGPHAFAAHPCRNYIYVANINYNQDTNKYGSISVFEVRPTEVSRKITDVFSGRLQPSSIAIRGIPSGRALSSRGK